MTDILRIEVKGLDKVLAKFNQFPDKIKSYLVQAGEQAAERDLLPTKGLKTYPPMTSANQPPTPYYIRTKGMQHKTYNDENSENLGKQWYVKSEGINTKIGNSASYAKWVHGDDDQVEAMASIGWKKLFATAKEKVGAFTKTYQAWIDKLIKDLGL